MQFFSKGSGPLLSPQSDYPALRMLLLVLVFAGTASAFWWHFERRMADMAPPAGQRFLVDQERIVPVEEARQLSRWRDIFKQGMGLGVQIVVTSGALHVPVYPQGTLFVGVGLASSEAIIVLPPLARKVMGEGPRLQQEEALALCLKGGTPAPCLQTTLNALWQHLGEE